MTPPRQPARGCACAGRNWRSRRCSRICSELSASSCPNEEAPVTAQTPTPETPDPYAAAPAHPVAHHDVQPPPPAGGFGSGLGAAVGAAVVGAIAWAVITTVTNYRIGFAAVAIGFLVGLAIERFGGGDPRLPVIGAVVALIGCVAGDML